MEQVVQHIAPSKREALRELGERQASGDRRRARSDGGSLPALLIRKNLREGLIAARTSPEALRKQAAAMFLDKDKEADDDKPIFFRQEPPATTE